MKKFMSFFSFIALAVLAISFVSCSDSDDPVDPQKDVYIDGSMKVALLEPIFEYCDVVAVLEYDGKTETYKLDDKTKVDNTELIDLLLDGESPDGRIVNIHFTHKPGKTNLHLSFTVTEEGKKKIEAAGNEDEVHFVCGMKLEANHGSQISQNTHTYQLKTLEKQLKSDEENKIYTLVQ